MTSIRAALETHAEACRIALGKSCPRPKLHAETHANLTGANLTGANLARASLAHASLVGANLAGANLAHANLAGGRTVKDWFCIGPIGSRRATLTALLADDGSVEMLTGCYRNSIDAFSAAVEKTHGATPHGDDYRAAIAMVRSKFARLNPKVEKP